MIDQSKIASYVNDLYAQYSKDTTAAEINGTVALDADNMGWRLFMIIEAELDAKARAENGHDDASVLRLPSADYPVPSRNYCASADQEMA